MKFGRKDYTIAFKTGTDANKAKFKKECVQGEIYHATDTGFFYVAEVTAGLNDATLSKFEATPFNEYSISLDGTDDFINVNGVATNIASMTNFSVSAWVKTTQTLSDGIVFRAAQSRAIHVGFYIHQGYLVTTVNGGGLTEGWDNGGANIADGNWHHLVMTYTKTATSASTALGYVDGNLHLTTNGTGTIQSGINEAAIGRRPKGSGTGDLYFDGLIDEVAVFNSVLSPSDISTLRGGASAGTVGVPADISSLNPVGWWRMGDGSDGSGNADGTLVNIGGTNFPQIYNVATDGSGNRITGIDGSLTNIASPNGIVTDVP